MGADARWKAEDVYMMGPCQRGAATRADASTSVLRFGRGNWGGKKGMSGETVTGSARCWRKRGCARCHQRIGAAC